MTTVAQQSVLYPQPVAGADASGYAILFNWCPRCAGTMYRDCDYFGWYVSCVACGYVSYPNEAQVDGSPLAVKDGKRHRRPRLPSLGPM